MDAGMMMLFTNYGWDDCPDGQVWEEELRLAALAANSGFDCLWSAEHHFNDYSFVPDNMHLMSHLTALYPDIDIGTAAPICPVNPSTGLVKVEYWAARSATSVTSALRPAKMSSIASAI